MANDERASEDPVSEEDTAAEGPASSDRRRALKYGVLAALAGLATAAAGLRALDGSGADGGDEPGPDDARPDAATPMPTQGPTPAATPAEPVDFSALVERLAPDLYFGRRERWFPTDPRPYASEVDGRTVVHGFDALAGYSRSFRETGSPPRPSVFYHVVPLSGSRLAVQYWLYSVFDQFAVNFHWHDWELLQVFVDAGTGEVLLLSASAHARQVPNNEFLRPDLGSDGRPAVLTEVGSHSSALDVNGRRPSFERLSTGVLGPDVTNATLRPLDRLTAEPFAYGLPRDEGARLPYVLPDLDGVPLPEHPALPDVSRSDFVDEDVTVRSWGDLARPPSALPGRERGRVFTAPTSQVAGDATYDLVPLSAVADVVDDFTGPRLSFELSIPGFVEERFADHLTTAGIPWEDPRFSDPASDVTDPAHRRAVSGDAPGGLSDRVVGAVSTLLGRPDGDLDAVGPDDRGRIAPFVPVSRFPLPVEAVCLLRSDPVATVTSGGAFRFLNVEPGAHELVVNASGLAPYAERFVHGGGTVRPGVGGRVTLVPNEDAVLLRADRRDAGGIRRVRIVETFAGPVFDARPTEAGRFAVAVHREGEYTVEVVDDDGVRGAVNVRPDRLDGEPLPRIDTGKESLARALAVSLADAASMARELGVQGDADGDPQVPAEFDAASTEASQAAEFAVAGDWQQANELLVSVVVRLRALQDRLADGRRGGYAPAAASLLHHRASDGIDRAKVAYATPVVG